jgi:hypothetical protein
MLTPRIRLFFICAHCEIDEQSNTITLVNPVFELRLPKDVQFPFIVGSLYAYANLSEGLGSFRLHVEVSDEEGRLITKSKPFRVDYTVANRKEGDEYVFAIPEFKIEKPGVYTVGLYQNYKCIVTTDVCLLSFGE